jgi:hypothetical protein
MTTMLDDFHEIWETALGAAERAYDLHASGKVFHMAVAALNAFSSVHGIPEKELVEAIRCAKNTFRENANGNEDFAQLKALGFYFPNIVAWKSFLPMATFTTEKPDNLSLESMKPETRKNILIHGAVILAITGFTVLLVKFLRSGRQPQFIQTIPRDHSRDDTHKEKELIIICRADGALRISPLEQLEKPVLNSIMDNIRFYAYGTHDDLVSNFNALEESGTNAPYYYMLSFKLPPKTTVEHFDNPALRGAELRAVLEKPQMVVDDVKHLSSLPQSAILRSYL